MGQAAPQPNRVVNLVFVPYYRKLAKRFEFEANEEEKLIAVEINDLNDHLTELIRKQTTLQEQQEKMAGQFDQPLDQEIRDTDEFGHLLVRQGVRELQNQGGSFSFEEKDASKINRATNILKKEREKLTQQAQQVEDLLLKLSAQQSRARRRDQEKVLKYFLLQQYKELKKIEADIRKTVGKLEHLQQRQDEYQEQRAKQKVKQEEEMKQRDSSWINDLIQFWVKLSTGSLGGKPFTLSSKEEHIPFVVDFIPSVVLIVYVLHEFEDVRLLLQHKRETLVVLELDSSNHDDSAERLIKYSQLKLKHPHFSLARVSRNITNKERDIARKFFSFETVPELITVKHSFEISARKQDVTEKIKKLLLPSE